MEIVIASVLGLVLGGVVTFFVKKFQDEAKKKSAQIEAERIINRAKSEAQKIDKDSKARAKDFETRARKNVEQDILKQKNKLKSLEGQFDRKLKDQEEEHKRKMEDLERSGLKIKDREEKFGIAESRLAELEKKVTQEIEEVRLKLESVSSMTQEEARRHLISSLENEAREQAAQSITKIEQEAEAESKNRARRIIASALSRFASEYTSERTVSVMALPNEDMKGKIIGREGRNIRTLEALCGVDLIVDDTPEAVVISGFDPIRRELAKRTITRLMEDGRVHPARIEDVVEKTKSEIGRSMKEEGEKVCVEMGLSNVHTEIMKLLGSMKYRHSHTQNLLNHSMEVGYIAGLIASEMGLSVKLARRAGLLHDLGKAVDHTSEGSHAFAGAEFAKKYNEHEDVLHAIRAHHNEEKPATLLASIVQVSNMLSNSRPGARRPGMEAFINRLSDLESIGNSFEGVLKTFAVQAGKEVRVIVEASKVTEDQSQMLTRDVARKIEREHPHLGSVRVMVVRETRAVEFAR